MRLCRFEQAATTRIGFYTEETIVPLAAAAEILGVLQRMPGLVGRDPDSRRGAGVIHL